MLVRHKKFPQLIGTLLEDNFVQWNEPWLAATLIDDSSLFRVSSSEYEVVEEEEDFQEFFGPRNITCSDCFGRGVVKVTDRRELLTVGPYKECKSCKGSGFVKVGDS